MNENQLETVRGYEYVRKKLVPSMLENDPTHLRVACSKCGWETIDRFTKATKQFKEHECLKEEHQDQ